MPAPHSTVPDLPPSAHKDRHTPCQRLPNCRIPCGGCPSLPCEKFTKDPTVSDEQNEEHLAEMLKNLKKQTGTAP